MKPTHVRRQVLVMLFLLSMITYLDRICISVAAPELSKELGLSPSQMGWVFSVFTLSYGLFEIPGGWLGDRFGPRTVLAQIVVWWSAFTALTGVIRGFATLLMVRFLFGAAEAGAYPNASCVIRRWFPAHERGSAQGIVWTAASVGGALTPFLVVPIQNAFGWRAAFFVFSSFGVFWAALWYRWFRDNPGDKPSLNEAELSLIGEPLPSHAGTPFRKMARSGNLWVIMLMYHILCYGSYWFIFWMPSYLVEEKGLKDFAPYAAAPYILGAVANFLGGYASDLLVKKLGLKWGRRTVALAAGIGGGGCVLLAIAIDNLTLAMGTLAIGYAAIQFALPNSWAVCLDVGRENAGAVSGAMNTAGQLGGTISLTAIGYAIKDYGWNAPLYGVAFVYLAGSLLWLWIDPTKPVVPEENA